MKKKYNSIITGKYKKLCKVKKTTYFHGGNDGQHHVSVEQ